MINFSESLSLSPFVYSVILLFTVLLSKYFMMRITHHQPLAAFQFYCVQLANKVNNTSRPTSQQQTAGLIAVIVTITPLIVILWLFADFINLPVIWHGVLLYLAIDGLNLSSVSNNLANALNQQNKYAAKQVLSPYVLRNTAPLSVLGLTKSCIEMQLIRTAQQLFTIAFYFIVFGPLTALTVRLLLEMHYCWNIKKTAFNSFGMPINRIVNILQWLPIKLFSFVLLMMSIGQNFILFWRLTKQEFFSLTNNTLLASFSFVMGIKLSGVAMYDNKKLRRKEFNTQGRQPEIADIKRASILINQVLAFYFILLATVAGLLWLLHR